MQAASRHKGPGSATRLWTGYAFCGTVLLSFLTEPLLYSPLPAWVPVDLVFAIPTLPVFAGVSFYAAQALAWQHRIRRTSAMLAVFTMLFVLELQVNLGFHLRISIQSLAQSFDLVARNIEELDVENAIIMSGATCLVTADANPVIHCRMLFFNRSRQAYVVAGLPAVFGQVKKTGDGINRLSSLEGLPNAATSVALEQLVAPTILKPADGFIVSVGIRLDARLCQAVETGATTRIDLTTAVPIRKPTLVYDPHYPETEQFARLRLGFNVNQPTDFNSLYVPTAPMCQQLKREREATSVAPPPVVGWVGRKPRVPPWSF
jgi:hypothetical protein